MCKTTNWQFITICNCIYIVVIVLENRWDSGQWLGWWLSSSDVTFLRKSQGLVKKHSYFMQAVGILLWTDCFETYICIAPRPQLSWTKPGNFSFDNMGPLRQDKHFILISLPLIFRPGFIQHILKDKAKSQSNKRETKPKRRWSTNVLVATVL